MGYNGPAPEGSKPPPPPPSPVPWGKGPFGQSRVKRSSSAERPYRRESVGGREPEDRSLLRGLFWLLFLGS